MSPRASSEEIKKPAGPVLRILTCTCPLSGLTLFTHFLTISQSHNCLFQKYTLNEIEIGEGEKEITQFILYKLYIL